MSDVGQVSNLLSSRRPNRPTFVGRRRETASGGEANGSEGSHRLALRPSVSAPLAVSRLLRCDDGRSLTGPTRPLPASARREVGHAALVDVTLPLLQQRPGHGAGAEVGQVLVLRQAVDGLLKDAVVAAEDGPV